ncbi:MAG: phospho-sugar mutase [Spirochaetota bacterium]
MSQAMSHEQLRSRAQEYVRYEEDELFRGEVERLLEEQADDELADRFYTDLEFGTGGLRGVIGGGFNRMNSLVVARATEGLARYVSEHGERSSDGDLRAVIAHDSRRFSDTFALQAALVFAAHGIKTFLFPSLRPTPELSFAVRKLEASVGVVVTASHNPPEYNGYKVYWADGAQIVAPHDKAIIEEVRSVSGAPSRMGKDEALEKGLLVYLDREIDDEFVAMVKRQSVRPELLKERGSTLKVVYTPLHGTGAMMVERVLGELGVEVITVPEQREPDGEFPTVEFPNPEEAAALKLALELGEQERADIVMGTDPDSDRLGIAVPGTSGYELLTGNQLGVLLADYILGQRKELGTLPEKPVFVKTVVTTDLQRKVAERYGATVHDTLTGFKHIATVMRRLDAHPHEGTYVLGGEESYGYLIGTEVRDKDAITAAVLTAEMALFHVAEGRTVLQRLEEIYDEFGYYEEIQISRYFRGQSGGRIMTGLMRNLRHDPPASIAGVPVVVVKDFKAQTITDVTTGETRPNTELPVSNVLQWVLEDETVVSARPSGTEPKIKFYASVSSKPATPLDRAKREVGEELDRVRDWVEEQIATAEQGQRE